MVVGGLDDEDGCDEDRERRREEREEKKSYACAWYLILYCWSCQLPPFNCPLSASHPDWIPSVWRCGARTLLDPHSPSFLFSGLALETTTPQLTTLGYQLPIRRISSPVPRVYIHSYISNVVVLLYLVCVLSGRFPTPRTSYLAFTPSLL